MMINKDSTPPRDDTAPPEETTRDKAFRAAWTYLRGCIVILVFLLLARAASEAYTKVDEWLKPLSEWTESSAPSGVLALAVLIFGPWTIGKVIELFLTGRLFRKQRRVRAFQRMEQRLSTELRADQRRGYRVALVDWPSKETRSSGLVVADLSEPDTGRELVAVYLPGTPDPSKGAIRLMGAENLTITEWDLSDLTRFHVTFGTAAPDLSDADSAS